jgi:hypothetical protein
MTAASIDVVGRRLGPASWWLLRNLAMNYLIYYFIVDFWRDEPLLSPRGRAEYLPFALAAALAPALRMAAWLKGRRSSACVQAEIADTARGAMRRGR